LHNTCCGYAHNSGRVLQGNYWCRDYIMCLYRNKFCALKRLLLQVVDLCKMISRRETCAVPVCLSVFCTSVFLSVLVPKKKLYSLPRPAESYTLSVSEEIRSRLSLCQKNHTDCLLCPTQSSSLYKTEWNSKTYPNKLHSISV